MAGKLGFDSSNHVESNSVGGELPRAATTANRAPQAASFQAVVHNQNSGFRWQGWSENDEGELRIKIRAVASPKTGGIDGNGDRLSYSSFKLNHRRSSHFLTTRTVQV